MNSRVDETVLLECRVWQLVSWIRNGQVFRWGRLTKGCTCSDDPVSSFQNRGTTYLYKSRLDDTRSTHIN